MLGKVSVQPSVGHWKVLPAKKETGLSQHCAVPLGGDPGAVLIPFHAVFPYPPPGSMSTICAPRGNCFGLLCFQDLGKQRLRSLLLHVFLNVSYSNVFCAVLGFVYLQMSHRKSMFSNSVR